MILRQLRDIKNDTDDILVYGFDGTNNQKISTDINGKLDIVSVNLDIALSTLKTVLDNIDANTDTLEAKTQSIRDQLDVTLSTRASESTTQDILNALGVFSGTNILSELQNLTTSGLATDATLIQVRDYLDTVEIKLQDIINRLDVNLSTRASEATSIEIRDTIGQESGNTVLSKLTDLKDAIDNLELTVDNVNINTDELEAKVQSVRDQLDVLLSTRASEATTQAILNALGQESGTTLLDEIQSLISNLGSEDFATETTLIQVRDYLDTVEIKLQTIINPLDVNLSTRASETTLSSVLSQLDITLSALRDAIKGANNKDLSTLEADIESILAQLDVDLSTRASESTLQSLLNAVGEVSGTNLLTELQSILSQLDVALSTRASEATLLLVKSNLDDVKTKLDTLLAIDFATEATSVEIRDTIGQESGSTVLSRLLDIWNKLVELFNTGVAKVKIWDGTETVEVTTDNKLQTVTHGRGKISTLNSTTTPLGISGTFTGTWEEVLDYSHLVLTVTSDTDSALEGLIIEWSSDGIVINDDDKFTIYSNLGKQFSFGIPSKYFRVRYINGTIAQTSFSLTTLLKPFSQKPSSHRLGGSVVNEDDAELVKAVITGESDNTFVNVKVTSDGRLSIDTAPPDAPPLTTPVITTVYGSVTGTSDNIYNIPSGETLIIQRFSAGAEVESTAGNVIELWYDPNGTGLNMEIIDTIFASGTSDQHDLRSEFIGDGTNRIIMRRRRFSGGSKTMFGRWEGYY